jgi:branched-chain amino acid aminotransferase
MTDNIAFTVQPDAQRLSDAERGRLLADSGFGKVFTDDMATIRWSGGQGWHSAEVCARAPFTIDPASAVLHYAQEIFEGLKAYHGADGRISLFRPEENARRFRESAARMAMPQFPKTCSSWRLKNS